ncbi:hypothetical protein ACFXTH_035919 [Malus domestica]
MAVEFRSGLGDAWYDVLIVKDSCDRLRVKFVGFGDDHDDDYEGEQVQAEVQAGVRTSSGHGVHLCLH